MTNSKRSAHNHDAAGDFPGRDCRRYVINGSVVHNLLNPSINTPAWRHCAHRRDSPALRRRSRAALLEQARDKVDKAETTFTQIRNEAVRQIIVARNTLYAASTTLSAAAQTTFNAALAAYRNGVGSITDVTLAERQLLVAKNAATDAYSTAFSSAATLALAAGILGSAPPQ
jgi:Outer membrane efflux protein